MSRGRRISRVKFIHPSPEVAKKYIRILESKPLYHTPESFPKITKENLFAQTGTLMLDIGCGTGEFLNTEAQLHPDQYYIGIEISKRAVFFAVDQAHKKNLENVIYFNADFKLIPPLLVPNSFSYIFLNFPDPNYGAGNLKHRIFTLEFLDLIHLCLIPGGKIQVVTDQHPFLKDMLEISGRDPHFQPTHREPFLTDFTPAKKTRFQKAWERVERPVFRFELVNIKEK